MWQAVVWLSDAKLTPKLSAQKVKELLIEAYIKYVPDMLSLYLYNIKRELAMAHPSRWAQSVIDALTIGKVYYDASKNAVIGEVVVSGAEYLKVRAGVLEYGNQKHGPLFTNWGVEVWNADLDGRRTQDHTWKGYEVVWVHNTNYPHAKRIVQYKSKKTGKVRISEYKMPEFYPIYNFPKALPDEFNRTDGIHAADNAHRLAESQGWSAFATNVRDYLQANLNRCFE